MAPGWYAVMLLCLTAVWLPSASADLSDPRAEVYFANHGLRALMDWVTFRLTFDAESMVPDMAAGEYSFTVHGTPRFEPGLRGMALVAGGSSGGAIYPRAGNAPFETRGAISLWLCPLEWTHVNGGNTEFVMTTNASFYIQRQGPLHNPDGAVVRQEGVQLLMLSQITGNNCLMFGTESWPLGQWRLLVANWSWPVMQFSLDGGEFQSLTVKQSPTAENFGGLLIGSAGGEKTLMDEVTFYRRPLSLQEVRVIYEALRPKEGE